MKDDDMKAEPSITVQAVEGYHRKTIPNENESVLDHFDFNIETISSVVVYQRSPEDCPLARGNWVIDVKFDDGHLLALKLPKEMTPEQMRKYCQPLIDECEKYKAGLSQ